LFEIYRLGEVSKKNIFELGCGCINSPDDFIYGREFEPWLGRALYYMSANYEGVDLNNSFGEDFLVHKIDLSLENSLNSFKTDSLDVVCAYSFFDAPSLRNPQKTLNNLVPQLDRIIKSNEYFIVDLPQFVDIKK
jgi:hypothetical protein